MNSIITAIRFLVGLPFVLAFWIVAQVWAPISSIPLVWGILRDYAIGRSRIALGFASLDFPKHIGRKAASASESDACKIRSICESGFPVEGNLCAGCPGRNKGNVLQ